VKSRRQKQAGKVMVTIKDIARESGYSVSTVSRVLNNRNDVSPDARKKIEEVVAKFNFVPNNNAKHLKQNNSKAIGVLVKGISNMLFASVVEEIQRMIEKTEYTLVVSYLDEDADEVEQAILLCRERKPLGLLFLGGNPEYFHREFSGVDVPCVLVTNRANEMHFENLSSVATDDIAAARCAVDQLFVAGHRRIGILGGDFDKSYTSHQRFLGCEQSFSEHGAVLDVEHCYEKARFSFGSACRAMKRLIGKFPDVTAVFAMSDVMAIGAIRALRDLGYRVPEDVSVIGFDGTSLAEYYNPKLATIKQQHQTLANRSIEILFGQIELKKEPIHEIVPFEFVNGESIRVIDER
jgi:LacI family transcriptional regulator